MSAILSKFQPTKNQKKPMKIVSKPRLESVELAIKKLLEFSQRVEQEFEFQCDTADFDGNSGALFEHRLSIGIASKQFVEIHSLTFQFRDSLSTWKENVARSSDKDRDIMEADHFVMLDKLNRQADGLFQTVAWLNTNPFELSDHKQINLLEITA